MRADKFFAEKYGSRTKAAEAIEKGWILVNGKAIKPKTEINDEDCVTFAEPSETFVSNGGYKLQRAIKAFAYDCTGKTFADIGASTGGFTDCLLQNNAKRVYAIDVGESLLDESLLGNDKILLMENTNARYLKKEDFPERIDCVVTDVSFISLRLIFPVIREILQENGEALVLIKPQFECENKHIGKSGIVPTSAHFAIVKKVLGYLTESNLYPRDVVNAPVRKGKNVEYVLYVQTSYEGAKTHEQILAKIEEYAKLHKLEQLI